MTEPVNLWKPSTDVYKEKAIEAADIEAEHKQKLRELHESNLRKPWKQDKAPLGIRFFTWYYWIRAGICALLLLVIVSFPQSAPSHMLTGGIGSFLKMPGSKSEREARRKQIEQEAQEYSIPENAISDEDDPGASPEMLRDRVMAYLFLNMAVAVVVGFMWWNRSWKVRWVTMCYAGGLIAKAAINFAAGAASGVGSQIPPDQLSALLLALIFNGFIFLYLAFGYGVEKWFEEAP